ncbi:unnamed protein product [Rotaria sp. Silwood1]|nr:unnamed protein product [Rotaria sp. Silwood1]CAF3618334.1 unnamed protein product [Rotaria sp. Silwood1]CAF3626798.1 unnamed protein product [Rotaria sp. Silwood1]CAF4747484.1 unnamed protein product [Rotaria sp. Silwood1]CAF4928102.1 unnamed protein product [Rotaria sp. Silwood1]
MATSNSKYNSLFKELDSAKIYGYVKSFISNLHNHLNTLRADSFKPEHRDEFLGLCSQCQNLIIQTHSFCDKALPYLEYALTQFDSSDSVNVKILVEQLLSQVDPKHILEQCQRLEDKILSFNNRISTDEYYETSNIMPFLCTGSGTARAIVSLIGFLFMPVVLEVEMASETTGALITNNAVPSMILLSEGLTNITAENDFKQCKKKIIEASKYVLQMKTELSNIIALYDQLEIQLDVQDIYDLQPIYENLLQNMRDIHDICSKHLSI